MCIPLYLHSSWQKKNKKTHLNQVYFKSAQESRPANHLADRLSKNGLSTLDRSFPGLSQDMMFHGETMNKKTSLFFF